MQALKGALTSFLSSGDKASDEKLLSIQNSTEFWELACNYIADSGASPEGHFFVYNMLYRKVRAEWNKTDPSIQAAVSQAVAGRIEGLLSPLLMRRACLVLAAGATGNPAACEAFIRQSFGYPRRTVAVELLVALAEVTPPSPVKNHDLLT